MEPQQQEFIKISMDEFKKLYPNMSNDDLKFYFNDKSLLNFESDFIGIRKYNQLKQKQSDFNNYNFINPNHPQKTLSEKELNQIKKYEENHNVHSEVDYAKAKADRDNYFNKNIELTEGLLPDKKNIYKNFLISYKYLNGSDFILNEESIKNIEPIIKYFAFDASFFDSENSINRVGNKILEPSFKKGLLLIGNVGNGKTSVMNAIQYMIDFYFEKAKTEIWDTYGDWSRIKFNFKTCESLVSEYEFLKSGQEKEIFFSKYSKGNLFLDDIKREKDASNFGITNVIKSILEKRYNNQKNYSEDKINKVRTFGSMNFHESYPNDIDFAIQECGVRYGSHVYDRVFEMFNIIEFKGKSFRK